MASKLVRPPNRGAQLLQGKGTKREVAAAVHVSPGTSGDWLTGRRLPGPEARQRLRDRYGIEPSAWDSPPLSRAGARASDAAPAKATVSRTASDGVDASEGASSENNAAELHETIRSDLARLRGAEGGELELGKRSEVIKRLVDAQASLAKRTGAGQLTVDQILASSAWVELLGTITESLEHWPVAIWAVNRTLAARANGPESDEARDLRRRQIRACYYGDIMREARVAQEARANATGDERELLENPMLQGTLKIVTSALARHPEALADVIHALEARRAAVVRS